jgi:hypothetical protein
VAAGALGLVRPSPAQTVLYPPAAGPAAAAGAGRLEEMKVGLALLADGSTFPYPLTAHASGGAVELRGATPTVAARDRALAVARRHTRLPVVDAVEVRPDALRAAERLAADAVRQGAVEVLARGFGQAARGWEIKADDDGVVTVNGSANSIEEKLAVGQLLRQVRGCTGAANHLLVTPVMRAGRMVTQLTADGSLTVPGMLTNLDGAGQDAPAVAVSPPALPALAPPEPAPAARPAVWKAVSPAPAALPTPAPAATPRSPYAGRAEAQRPVVTRAALPEAPAASQWTPPPPSDGLALPRVMPSYEPSVTQTQFATSPYAGNTPAAAAPKPVPAAPAPAPAAPAPVADKDVDLLAAPEVPPSWNRKKAAKSKGGTSGSFATARPDLEGQMTADQLLALPAAPLPASGGGKGAPPPDAPVKRLASTASWKATDVPPPPEKPAYTAAPGRPESKVVPAAGKVGRVTAVGHEVAVPAPDAPPGAPAGPSPPPWTVPMTWVPYIHALAAAHYHILPPMQRVPEPPGGWQPAHAAAPPSQPAEPPAPSVPSVGVTGPVAAGPKAPRATHGVMIFAEDRHEADTGSAVKQVGHKPKPAEPSSPSAAKLKQKVEAACGPKARRVQVDAGPDGIVRVEVKVANDAAAKEVTEKVLRLPEMSAPTVRFAVTVGP